MVPCTYAIFPFALLAIVSLSWAQTRLTAGNISLADQIYDFTREYRCRLLAHKSAVLKNKDHHLLVIDGGFGKFKLNYNNEDVEVLDLNGYTFAFDLSHDFTTPDLEPLWQIKKSISSPRPPVVNHFGMFMDKEQNSIYVHNGHYYNALSWNESSYFTPKAQIPPWDIWKFDVGSKLWEDVSESTLGHGLVNRTFAGGSTSVTKLNKSFWIGGIIDPTTGSNTPTDTYQPTSQMLVYNHTGGQVKSEEYYGPPRTQGYWHGSLSHIPVGSKDGFLLSLMSQKQNLGHTYPDTDLNDYGGELGKSVTLENIQLYNVETGEWIAQEAAWVNSEPIPRTRFCTALFHDETDNIWDLWIHGGQRLDDREEGIREIYVLSMPSFTWTKLDTTLPDQNLIRSHTCHAVGGQLLIAGGYPPGRVVPRNATCDPELVKVLQITADGPSWVPKYSTNTIYRTPKAILNTIGGRRSPIDGWASTALEEAFAYSSRSGPNIGAVVGGTLGAVVGVVLLVGSVCIIKKRRKRRIPSPPSPIPGPPSPIPGQPGLILSQQGPIPSQQGSIPSQQGPIPSQQGPIPSQRGPIPSQQSPIEMDSYRREELPATGTNVA
ncbi:hypothetical protein GJ744_008985 [Endocarpon pusillum]|uniref:Kelch repeat-containing protein n=1 Tax=Endocarpon pusillum TaxID=364733 RepID=A0A8H7E5A9_9EURO|nr:hypothetical protein GJ744_008985 [Endocarpon pusillum]